MRIPIASVSRMTAVLGLLICRAVPLAAQESFARVQELLRPGDLVFVMDDTGAEIRGRIFEVTPTTLRLDVHGVQRELSAARIWEVTRPDSLRNGTLIGLTVGAAIGGIGGGTLASLLRNEGHDPLGPFLFLLGIGAGGGAAIGAGFDALNPGRTLVYRRRYSVTFAPTVTPHAQTLQLSIRF